MAVFQKSGGVFKAATSFGVKAGGVYKDVKEAWVKDGGVWKKFWPEGPPPINYIILDSLAYNAAGGFPGYPMWPGSEPGDPNGVSGGWVWFQSGGGEGLHPSEPSSDVRPWWTDYGGTDLFTDPVAQRVAFVEWYTSTGALVQRVAKSEFIPAPNTDAGLNGYIIPMTTDLSLTVGSYTKWYFTP